MAAEPLQPPPAAAPSRALALDALRGFAILAMCLSGRIHGIVDLPRWMRHAQFPDVANPWRFDGTVPGFTWVDLVFPMFLFAMGAAFPLAMASKLERGVPPWRMILGALGRALSLVAFAVYVDNIQPLKMGADPLRSLFGTSVADGNFASPTFQTWIAALLAFALLFPVFARLPRTWSVPLRIGIRTAGVLACWGLLQALAFPDGSSWTVRRFDIIIMVLANMAFFGAAIWVLTRNRPWLRLATLPFAYALLQAAEIDGSWVQLFTRSSFAIGQTTVDFSWMYQFSWLKYLFIVVPGSIVGDHLREWMKNHRPDDAALSRRRLVALSFAALALIVLVHACLQTRGPWLVVVSFLVPALWLSVRFAMPAGESATGRFLRQTMHWGFALLVLGLAFEPVEGGIRKDPSNMSYYFVAGGLSAIALFALTIWIDVLNWRKPFAIPVMNGQNPMIAYVGIRNLLSPLVELAIVPAKGGFAGLRPLAMTVLKTPWAQAAFGFLETFVLAGMTAIFTRLRIYWRT